MLLIIEWSFVQGKKQAKRIESLVALEKIVKNALSVLGLMPTRYSEVNLLFTIPATLEKSLHMKFLPFNNFG